jgi:hypothetical protein
LLRDFSLGFVALLRFGQKPTNPNDLLKTLIFADFEDDLLSVTELVRGKPVTKVGKPGNILSSLVESEGRGTLSTGPQENPNGADWSSALAEKFSRLAPVTTANSTFSDLP